MAKQSKPQKTFHVSVPEGDVEITEWLNAQFNQSSSIRQLIRDAAEELGMVDLFVGLPAKRDPNTRGRAKQVGAVYDSDEIPDGIRLNSRGEARTSDWDDEDGRREKTRAANQARKDKKNKSPSPEPKGNGSQAKKEPQKVQKKAGSGNAPPEPERKPKPARMPGATTAPKPEKARDRSRTEKRRRGIRMDASVLAEASGKRVRGEDEQDTREKKKQEGKRENDTIRNLMAMMDV